MEEFGNIFEKQGVSVTKTKVGKPPTRLQKHAPASLKLDQMKAATAAATPTLFGPPTGASPAAIPLLSPLILSPNPFTDSTEDQFLFPTWNNNGNIADDKIAAIPTSAPTPTPTAFGWKHPAVPGYVEPSTLFTLFQTKCLLVNDA